MMLLICILFTAAFCHSVPELKTFEIKLDADPLHRFDEPNRYFYKQTREGIDVALRTISDVIKKQTAVIYYSVVKLKYVEFARENEGIAKLFNVTEHEMFIYQLMYELRASCTSLVAVAADGTIIHGRNLDYAFGEYLTLLHYVGIFTIGGKEVYRAPLHAGSIGLNTGVKKGKFAISLNQRFTYGNIQTNLEALNEGSSPVTWAVRHALNKLTTYSAVVEYLSTVGLVAPGYLIISGIGKDEGVVLTRKHKTLDDKWEINTTKGEWFLVQINSDREQIVDEMDGLGMDKKEAATKRLKEIGREKLTTQRVFDNIMRLPPNNCSITIFCSAMCAKDGTLLVAVNSL